MTHFLDYLADRVVLCDGAMGTQVQARQLDIERDFLGNENCTEIVCQSRPDLIREIHRGYLAAGCDAVQTNSFGGSPITLGEFGLADRAFALNRLSAEIAREAVAEFAMTAAPALSWARSGRAPACRRSAMSPTRSSKTRWRSSAPG